MVARPELDPHREWMRNAPCHGQTALFYADERWLKQQAKEICGDCILQKQCRDFARHTREEYGVWGGEDETERATVIRRTQRQRRQQQGA